MFRGSLSRLKQLLHPPKAAVDYKAPADSKGVNQSNLMVALTYVLLPMDLGSRE